MEERIDQARVIAFLVSKQTTEAAGQQREIELPPRRISSNSSPEISALLTDDDVEFPALPKQLQLLNGDRLSAFNVKRVAFEIANQFFPETVPKWEQQTRWRYPRPGDWLEICRIEGAEVEESFKFGDQVQVRRLSLMGLFECYAPKIKGRFWFWHGDLRPVAPTNAIWQSRDGMCLRNIVFRQ